MINCLIFDYTKEDSKELQLLMKNYPTHSQFVFKLIKVIFENSKLIEILIAVVEMTAYYISINYATFSTKEFCELVWASKQINKINPVEI